LGFRLILETAYNNALFYRNLHDSSKPTIASNPDNKAISVPSKVTVNIKFGPTNLSIVVDSNKTYSTVREQVASQFGLQPTSYKLEDEHQTTIALNTVVGNSPKNVTLKADNDPKPVSKQLTINVRLGPVTFPIKIESSRTYGDLLMEATQAFGFSVSQYKFEDKNSAFISSRNIIGQFPLEEVYLKQNI